MRHIWRRNLLVFQVLSAAAAFQWGGGAHRFLGRRRPSNLRPTGDALTRTRHSSSSEDDDDGISLDGDDWRAFRAKLVLGNQEGDSASSSSSWAYDSGHVIEPGSIILAKVEPDFCYFGLNQQYFHKSVMIVTYHKENDFTKGIILNRPTNLFLGDEDFLNEEGEPYLKAGGDEKRTENSWRIWFGGDVAGLYSDNTEIICLHSVDTEIARNVSEVLMNDVMMTNYEGAIKIINAGQAEARQFWVFAGYAGWAAGQLLDELKRESWYMVSADSELVWQQLVGQRDEENANPRDAGLKTWSSLMGIIGKEKEATALSESFADLTLKEWAADAILFNSTTTGSVGVQEDNNSSEVGSTQLNEILSSFSAAPDTLDKMVKLAVNAQGGLAGSLLRASPHDRSPFLLADQQFHKSLLLILQDDDEMTVGVMLNQPRNKTRPMTLPDGRTVQIPIRFGGSFGIPGVTAQPTIFIHTKARLKDLSVGEPVGRTENDSSKIWICTEEQVITSISGGLASHRDFMCIEGFSIWNKDAGPIEGGILGEMIEGKFELVDPSFTEEIGATLLAQASLSLDTIDRNCCLASDAWGVAERNEENLFPPCVYDSSITVSELSDDALRYWVEASLLGGVVSAAGKYSAFE